MKKAEDSTSFKIETTVATPQMFKKLLGDDTPDEEPELEKQPKQPTAVKNNSLTLAVNQPSKSI